MASIHFLEKQNINSRENASDEYANYLISTIVSFILHNED
jgi:hypothetical protein